MKKYYARLLNAGGELDCIEESTIEGLWEAMREAWPILNDGDTIKIEHI